MEVEQGSDGARVTITSVNTYSLTRMEEREEGVTSVEWLLVDATIVHHLFAPPRTDEASRTLSVTIPRTSRKLANVETTSELMVNCFVCGKRVCIDEIDQHSSECSLGCYPPPTHHPCARARARRRCFSHISPTDVCEISHAQAHAHATHITTTATITTAAAAAAAAATAAAAAAAAFMRASICLFGDQHTYVPRRSEEP